MFTFEITLAQERVGTGRTNVFLFQQGMTILIAKATLFYQEDLSCPIHHSGHFNRNTSRNGFFDHSCVNSIY